MFKLDLEKAEEPEIKLPTSAGSQKSKRVPESIYYCSIYYAKVFVWIMTNCGKFLKRWEHLTCLLRNLYAGQEATLTTGHGTTDCFQIKKEVRQGCILSPCLFNLYSEYNMRTLDWKKHKLESRLLEEITITSDMQMTPALWQKVKRNSKAS